MGVEYFFAKAGLLVFGIFLPIALLIILVRCFFKKGGC